MERIDWVYPGHILKISKPNGNIVYEFGRSDDQIVTRIYFYNVGN
jgi:hypothetical protein